MAYSFLQNINLKSNTNSCWFSSDKKTFRKYLLLDNTIKSAIYREAKNSINFIITNVYIEISTLRSVTNVKVLVGYARAGKRLHESKVKSFIEETIGKYNKQLGDAKIEIELVEHNKALVHPFYVAQYIQRTMKKRISYRKLTRIAEDCINGGAKGCVLEIKGRVNSSEITRKDKVIRGSVARNTLVNNISYCQHVHVGKSGCVGIKVWINRGNKHK